MTDDATPRERRAVPTIYDLARAAGVTIGTASKALNGRGQLRPETRERVRAEAARLGFRPNDLAQSLMRGRTFTVGLLTTDPHGRIGRFVMPLLAGVEDTLGAERISVFLCNGRGDPEAERQHIEALLAKQVDGIVVMGQQTDLREPVAISAPHVPVVYAYTRVADPHAHCLLPDDAQGARIVTEHLLSLGRRHFAHITGPERFEAVRLRRDAMRETLAAHRLDLPDTYVLAEKWSEAWGYEAGHRLLAAEPDVDAIFCGNDLIARGVLDALRECGRRVPYDVAVIGFDNWDAVAPDARPPLTSVDMNLRALGEEAGTRLLAMIAAPDGELTEGGVIRLPCSLVVRQSCGGGGSETASGMRRGEVAEA